ncbi:hypothetical protein [Aureimonas glaciei]|uniref:Uncharacterized protein n=1 Tax=Aureimonas glaciei TaxID=1776957 RepID=A0A916Y1W0_9HYPH|nr:hypothetical protein [Aureimonas glaciei]GGD27719.1 hypothetical protein GCM10011335_33530 [Aureimonas glaciei]
MQFEYTPPQTAFEHAFGGHNDVNAFGKIEPGDDLKFLEFLQKSAVPTRASIYIDSLGGHVETAISLGHMIRERWFSTHIGSILLGAEAENGILINREFRTGSCMSAATLMYIGGRLRYFSAGSSFGVHQFSFRNPTPRHIGQSQTLSYQIARFIRDMGVDLDFLDISSSVDSSEIKLIDVPLLRQLRVVTDGETPVSWTVLAANNTVSVRAERDSLYGHHKILLSYLGGNFMIHAVIESQGRSEMLESYPLVELTFNEDDDIDISDRVFRVSLNSYTNIICKITLDEARQIVLSKGFGVQVRGSRDAGMFLGISPMSTESGRDKLTSFFTALTGEVLISPELAGS